MKEYMTAMKNLYQPKQGDSAVVRRCKAEMAAIQAGQTEYTVDGQTTKVQDHESAYRNLKLQTRWGSLDRAKFHD